MAAPAASTPTTVVDLTTDTPVVLRFGKGDTSDFESES